MKHIFIINPNSGKGKGYDMIYPKIKECIRKYDLDAEIYVSKSAEDTFDYTKNRAAEGKPVRVYACGGDGTVYNVANAIYGYDNAQFALVPLGSGNDFLRLFGTKEQFLNLDAQVSGTPVKIDAIQCGDRIAVNQCSMGFDAEVCAKQADFKKIPWLSGETAYTSALLYCVMNRRSRPFEITIDDGEPMKSEFLFAFCGNSRYYGGGFQPGPYAVPDDGLLDFSLIKNMSLPKLLSRINEYKKGRHYTWEETTYLRGRKMTVKSETPAAVNIDGECDFVTEATFKVLPEAFTFVIPTTSEYLKNRKNGIINDEIGTVVK